MSVEDIREELDRKTQSSGDVDYISLRESMSVISRIVSTVSGILIVTIIFTISIVILLEALYILFNVFRAGVDSTITRYGENRRGKILGFAFRDARLAVMKAETVETGKSALSVYMWIKCKSVMFIMFIVAIILMGSGPIIDLVWDLATRVINIIT
jgi:hypothetical protein